MDSLSALRVLDLQGSGYTYLFNISPSFGARPQSCFSRSTPMPLRKAGHGKEGL